MRINEFNAGGEWVSDWDDYYQDYVSWWSPWDEQPSDPSGNDSASGQAQSSAPEQTGDEQSNSGGGIQEMGSGIFES